MERGSPTIHWRLCQIFTGVGLAVHGSGVQVIWQLWHWKIQRNSTLVVISSNFYFQDLGEDFPFWLFCFSSPATHVDSHGFLRRINPPWSDVLVLVLSSIPPVAWCSPIATQLLGGAFRHRFRGRWARWLFSVDGLAGSTTFGRGWTDLWPNGDSECNVLVHASASQHGILAGEVTGVWWGNLT